MATTKKPTGLSITRDGNKYAFKWKIADDNYGAGQKLQYRTHGSESWRDWQTISVTSSATSKVATISKSDFYPTTSGKYLTEVGFRVRGQRSSYTKDGKTITPEVSDWSEKTMTISKPNAPVVSGGLGSQWNISSFAWSIESSDSGSKIFTGWEWQSIIVKESTETDGSQLKWSSSNSGWATATGTSTSSTKTFTEDTTQLNQGSRTRWFRIRSRGPAGYTDWKYAKHIFAIPNKPVIKNAKVSEKSSNYLVTVEWTATTNYAHPIDEVEVQYAVGTPTANMQPPSSPSWTTAVTAKDTTGNDKASFYTSGKLQADECLWVRIEAKHDTRSNQSDVYLALVGTLASPTNVSATVNNGVASVSATNASSACIYTGSVASTKKLFMLVKYKDNADYKTAINVGVMNYNATSASINVPTANTYKIGVQAVVGTYSYTTQTDGTRRYTVDASMKSPIVWYGGTLPVEPTGLNYDYTDGKLQVMWNWSWSDAEEIELSWSENPNAWESTEEPDSYKIEQQATSWYVDGLETGKTYYLRARFYDSDNDIYSPYSEALEINLTSPPVKPILKVSDSVISTNGKFTLSWTYSSTDGSEQEYAEVIYNSQLIAHTQTAKYVTLYASELGWTANTYAIKVRVKSESGSFSDYSDEITVEVVSGLTATISQTSLSNVTVTDDTSSTRTVLSLTAMPLTVTVTGAGNGGYTNVAIERAEAYYSERPDGAPNYGYEGETVYNITQVGEAQITVQNEDLMGYLDDGAKYRIVATVLDGLGQTSTATRDFEVHWSHQAIVPNGSVVMDGVIAKITPTAPTGTTTGDYCDIYRLSKDRPELIYPHASFGTTYVDPYPAINGGHRIVFRTANGDYITSANKFAWLDLDDVFSYDKAIIEFGEDKVELYYNVDSNHNWSKDFIETKYLGGSVQGDWNPAVSRTGSVSGITMNLSDEETIEALRRLAVWSGICNVRTKDGSSFHANVDVSESNSHDRYGLISEFSLNFTRVDPQGYDGIPLSVWSM